MALTQVALIELIQQMPPTDREVEALQAAQTPSPDQPTSSRRQPSASRDPASKFTGPDPAAAERICAQILAGGRGSVVELIRLIRDPGDPGFIDYKAEYLLHCLVLVAGRPGNNDHRKLLVETLASQLSNDRIPRQIRGFLIRELQWIGDKGAIEAIAPLLRDEELCQDAVLAWVALGGSSQPGQTALDHAQGRNRLSLVQCLAALQNAESVDLLRRLAGDEDLEVRLAAAWGLANAADAGSLDRLLKMADGSVGFERVKATQACLLLAEKLAARGLPRDAARIYTHLRDTRTEKAERYLRELAEKALRGLVV